MRMEGVQGVSKDTPLPPRVLQDTPMSHHSDKGHLHCQGTVPKDTLMPHHSVKGHSTQRYINVD